MSSAGNQSWSFGKFPKLEADLVACCRIRSCTPGSARPAHVPIVRIIDDTLSTMMSEYAVYAVLGFHRFMPQFQSDQSNKIWKKRWPNFTPDTHIGVLGIGAIGSDVAYKLRGLGFQVHGWSRNPKQLEGISCHAGKDGLFEILPQCQQIVVVLPLTSETRGSSTKRHWRPYLKVPSLRILAVAGMSSTKTFSQRWTRAISAAPFSMFSTKSLCRSIILIGTTQGHHDTPCRGRDRARSCAQSIAANIERYRRGEPLDGIADIERGY